MSAHGLVGEVPRYLREFAEYASGLTAKDLPEEVLRAVRLVFVDDLGSILIGHLDPEMARLCDDLLPLGGKPESTVLRRGFPKTDRALAAFLNGVAGPAHELDEGYRLSSNHASVSIVTVVLAEGEVRRSTGAELAAAIAVGYEAGARASKAAKFGYRTQAHGLFSSVGTCVAVAKLRGGDSEEIAAALNYGVSLTLISPHVQSYHGGTVRNLWNGLGTHAPFLSQDLADAGFRVLANSAADTYGYVSGRAFDPSIFTTNLGTEFAITHNYFKRYACCGHVFAPIEATLAATRSRRIRASDVETIDVSTYRLSAYLNDPSPINPFAARFSVPWHVATAVTHGEVDIDACEPRALLDQDTRALAERVSVTVDPGARDVFSHDHSAHVAIRLKDGQILEGRCDNAPGDYRLPFSDGEMDQKFLKVAGHAVGEGAAEILKAAKGILQVPDLSELLRLVATVDAIDPPRTPLPLTAGRTQRARDYLDDLSEFVALTTADDLAESVRRRGKRILMEDLGAILRGSEQPEVRRFAQLAAERAQVRTATLIGVGFARSGPLEAALVNGTAAASRELEGGYWLAGTHPGIYAIPAALAWGEHAGASGKELLTAVILGYDVAARIAAASNVVRAAHPHGLWGVVGSAVSVAKLMGLDATEIRETISIAACLAAAASTRSAWSGASIVSVYNGRSSYCGILAAISARDGYASPLDGPGLVFGGAVGDAFDGSRVVANLGVTYEMMHHYYAADEDVEARFRWLSGRVVADPAAIARTIWDLEASGSVCDLIAQMHG